MKVLFLCPGQGAQTPEFLSHLPKSLQMEETLEEAADILGFDLREKDTAADLETTYYTQLTIVTATVGCGRFLIAQGFFPQGVLGFSLGSYAAAVLCGSLSWPEALKLLEKRASIMQSAFSQDYGMAAIEGLSEEEVAAIVKDFSNSSVPLYIANINAPKQIVVSGHMKDFPEWQKRCLSEGASRVVRLKVSTPSHSPLFAPYIPALQQCAESLSFKDPTVPFFSPMLRRAVTIASLIQKDLVQNMASPLNIWETASLAYEKGFHTTLEMLPGHILTRLFTTFLPNLQALALSTFPVSDILEPLSLRIPKNGASL